MNRAALARLGGGFTLMKLFKCIGVLLIKPVVFVLKLVKGQVRLISAETLHCRLVNADPLLLVPSSNRRDSVIYKPAPHIDLGFAFFGNGISFCQRDFHVPKIFKHLWNIDCAVEGKATITR